MEIDEVAARLVRQYWALILLCVLVPLIAITLTIARQPADVRRGCPHRHREHRAGQQRAGGRHRQPGPGHRHRADGRCPAR